MLMYVDVCQCMFMYVCVRVYVTECQLNLMNVNVCMKVWTYEPNEPYELYELCELYECMNVWMYCIVLFCM